MFKLFFEFIKTQDCGWLFRFYLDEDYCCTSSRSFSACGSSSRRRSSSTTRSSWSSWIGKSSWSLVQLFYISSKLGLGWRSSKYWKFIYKADSAHCTFYLQCSKPNTFIYLSTKTPLQVLLPRNEKIWVNVSHNLKK